MGVVIVSPPTGLCLENWPLSYVSLFRATYCTEYGQETGYHRIGSVHAVIRQAGTNWAGPVRIQIYYGPVCTFCQRTWMIHNPSDLRLNKIVFLSEIMQRDITRKKHKKVAEVWQEYRKSKMKSAFTFLKKSYTIYFMNMKKRNKFLNILKCGKGNDPFNYLTLQFRTAVPPCSIL